MKKRLLSIALSAVMLITVVFCTNISVLASVTEPTSVAELNARMASITSGTYGIGKYFRDNQSQPCYFAGTSTACHKNHGGDYSSNDAYCNCRVATADIAGTTGGIQCFGFMRYVFYQLFGLPLAQHMISSLYALSSNVNVTVLGQCTASATSTTVQNIFGSAKMGDAIQARTASGGAHSMIVYSLSTTGVTVLEANYAAQCYIGTRTMTWAKFASTYPAFTVYRSNNYPGTLDNVLVPEKYAAVVPFKSYIQATSTIYPYTSNTLATLSGGEIWTSDECTVTAVYSNGSCQVTYPVSSGTKTAYVLFSEFVKTPDSKLQSHTFGQAIIAYTTSAGTSQYTTIPAGTTGYKLGQVGDMTEVFFSSGGSMIHCFVKTADLDSSVYYDNFLLTKINGIYYKVLSYEGSYTDITIPASYNGYPVSAIAANAFSLSSITSVTIPASVTEIGNQAFANCSALKSAYFLGNVPASFGDDVFLNTASGFKIYYHADSTGWATPTFTSSSGDAYSATPVQISSDDMSSYTVAESSGGNRYLEGISVGDTVSDIISNTVSGDYLIVDGDGNTVSSTERVGTGYKLQLLTEGGSVMDEVEIIVYGDTTGDGYINAKDMVLMHRYYWYDGETDTAYCRAARVSGQDEIVVEDLVAVSDMIVG